MSIRPVLPQLLVSKMSHIIFNGVTMSRVTLFNVINFGSKSAKSDFFIIYNFSITKNK
jgi:hypothetical protein